MDIDNQVSDNYHYDEIGNLVSDNGGNVSNFQWNVYGKIINISRVNPQNPGDPTDIKYMYDPNGNRVGKRYWEYSGTGRHQWFVRDAQGNIMAVYDFHFNPDWSAGPLRLVEHDVYGSSRLGVMQRNQDMSQDKVTPVNADLVGNTYLYSQSRGLKLYELTNHLGNVLATISDKKIGHDGGSGNIDYYTADVVNATDYYPFGMMMPGRGNTGSSGLDSTSYRFGFNGKENDNEAKGEGNQQNYGMRFYDTRVGRFLSLDPLQVRYPQLSPYQYAGNIPTAAIDLDGLETVMHYYVTSVKNFGSINVLNSTTSNGQPGYTAEFTFMGRHFTSAVYASQSQVKSLVGATTRSLGNAWVELPNGQDIWYKKAKTLEDIAWEDNQNAQEIQTGEARFQQALLATMALSSALVETAPINRSSMTGTTSTAANGQVTRLMSGNPASAETNTASSQEASLTKNAIQVVDRTPQTGLGFNSQSYTLNSGKINLNNRAVTNGTFDFVVTNEGKLVIGSGHYYLSNEAETVQAAGQMSIYKGKVTNISNSSGHYQPGIDYAKKFGDILKKIGVDVSRANLNLYDKAGKKVETVKL